MINYVNLFKFTVLKSRICNTLGDRDAFIRSIFNYSKGAGANAGEFYQRFFPIAITILFPVVLVESATGGSGRKSVMNSSTVQAWKLIVA